MRKPLTAAILSAVICLLCAAAQASTSVEAVKSPLRSTASTSALPTSSQVVAAVAAGAKLKQAPADLQPPANAVSQYGGLDSQQQPCDSLYAVTVPPTCQIGDSSGKTTLVLWGDSHAAMWIPAMQAIALHIHAKLYVYSKAGCAPGTVEPVEPTASVPYAACTTFKKHTLADIAKLHANTILITGAFKGWAYVANGTMTQAGTWPSTPGTWDPLASGEAVWDQSLTTTLATLKPMANKVIVIGDDAYPLQNQADCLSAHFNDLAACTTPRSEAVYAAHNADEARIAKQAGDLYVSTTQWMCTSTVCPPVIGGYAVYLDAFHITSEFSEWLADALGVATGLLPSK
jgi:hypothetical protein